MMRRTRMVLDFWASFVYGSPLSRPPDSHGGECRRGRLASPGLREGHDEDCARKHRMHHERELGRRLRRLLGPPQPHRHPRSLGPGVMAWMTSGDAGNM